MRGSRVAVGVLGAMTIAPLLAVAQQQPIHGCGTAISCRPLGFSTLSGPGGSGSLLFGVGFGWDPGFHLHIVAPQSIVLAPKPTPLQEGRLFHLGVSLLPQTPSPTPVPAPPR